MNVEKALSENIAGEYSTVDNTIYTVARQLTSFVIFPLLLQSIVYRFHAYLLMLNRYIFKLPISKFCSYISKSRRSLSDIS